MFCVCYQFISAQCDGVGIGFPGNKIFYSNLNCNSNGINQLLYTPFENPIVNFADGNLNQLTYNPSTKEISVTINNNNFLQDYTINSKIIVSDPNNPNTFCHLEFNLLIPYCSSIELFKVIPSKCDSTDGSIIIKRTKPCFILVKNSNGDSIKSILYTSQPNEFDTINGLKAGVYSIELFDINTKIVKQVLPNISINLPENLKIESKYKIVCEGNPLILNVPQAQKYVWSTGETTQSIVVNKGGKYAVEVINPISPLCQTKDTIDLKFNPRLTLEVIQSYKDCKSDSLDIIYRVKGGTAPYYIQHQPNGACMEGCLQKTDSVFNGSYWGYGYYVVASDASGCSVAKEYNHIPNSSNLKLALTKNIKLCKGDSTVFNDQYPNEKEIKHQWYLDGQAISQGTKNEFFAKKAGKYHVVVTTPSCEVKSDTVIVEEVVPDPIQFVQPPYPSCLGTLVTYQAEKNKSNYEWNILNQTKNIDYTLVGGGTDTSSFLSLIWYTEGPKQISLNYSTGFCKSKAPAIISELVSGPIHLITNSPSYVAICQGTITTYKVSLPNFMTIQPINLKWEIPGAVPGIDYEIVSFTESEISIKWLKPSDYKLSVFNQYPNNYCVGNNLIEFGINVNPIPQPRLTADKGSVCFGNVVEYKTESGKQNYVWNIPNKINGTDYILIDGGDSKSNTMKINWLTQGLNQITVNYTSSNGLCIASNPAEIYTQVQMPIELVHVTPEKSNVCLNTIATYKVKNLNAPYSIMNQQNLNWTVYGDPSRDYKVLAGGNATDSTITIQWLKATKTGIFVNTNNCGNSLSFDVTVFDTINFKKLLVDFPEHFEHSCKIDSIKLQVQNLTDNTFQWYLNDKEITNAFDSIFYAKLPGKYNVVIKNAGNCSFTSDYFEFKKDTCNSVAKLNDLQDDMITVYPNPASTLLNIDLNNPNVKSVALVNVLGQKVIHQDLQTMNNVINVQDVTKGMYLVSFFNERNEIISTKKITIE